ncbi:transglutaminase family protein [Litoribacter ruber]|uniref:Transglutaminase family protein n=1 Tax=Litoribacter ruber TaxID=702568 RepID=A0AAP2CG09_9BACT|nr:MULTISPECIES: transglutaminase family protein [Litoribacter]MBS9522894.1 transglutaminase family protein [Litoribacter alkaliphilus]MBT0812402.1 transglutaminase family protein [Litoribacter ruber]
MKSLRIVHHTRYAYSEKVQLNPHAIFMHPLQRDHFELKEYDLKISPGPVDQQLRFNIDGNPHHLAWFEGETDRLEIVIEFSAELRHFNPFAFILDHQFTERFQQNLNTFYTPEEKQLLYASLQYEPKEEIKNLAHIFFHENENPLTFLNRILHYIHQEWEHIVREDDGLWLPIKTLREKIGSCRDLSWMLIQMLRSLGLAAKFVSGYAYNPELEEGHELHAWVEVYLPGAGWVGIDPSLGLFTDEHYIPLASSAIPKLTLPVVGTYGGTAKSTLESKVYITPE